MGEGGSHRFKPVILDSAACIYEHKECLPQLTNKRDSCQRHEVLITYDQIQ